MYTVLIADDERIERNGIRHLLKKEKNKYKIYEAVNGREAEKIIKEEQVDILLTDICMPYLNGLELAKRTSRCSEDTGIIIFSGHHDFEYARRAMQYGVRDFLMKPIDPCELNRAILNVEKQLEEKREQAVMQEKRARLLNQYYLTNYILGKESISDSQKRAAVMADWNEIGYMMYLEGKDSFFEKYGDQFQAAIEKAGKDRIQYLNLNTEQGLLLFGRNLADPVKAAESLMDWLNRNYSTEFYLAVSSRIKSVDGLPEAYRRLDGMMEEKFYHTERHLFCEAADSAGEKLIDEGCSLGMLEKDIRSRNAYGLEEHFQRVIERYSGNSGFPSMYVKFVFSNIVKILWESAPGIEEHGMETVIDRMYTCDSVESLIEITQKQMDKYLRFISEDKSRLKYKVELTREYIKEHFREDIQVESLASKLYLSPGYLSMAFKREVGENIRQYIRNMRMEKATELLRDTDMTVSEIGAEVGFKNMSYFSKCFRQQFGDTPENYRKMTLDN